MTYTTEALAQFAKEAMAHQSLDHDEILNVRWATLDPNPQAQKREARKIEEQAAEAIRRALPEAFVREIEGRDPEAKRRRKEEGNFGLEGYEASDDVWFANEKAKIAIQDQQERLGLTAPDQQLLLELKDEAEHPETQKVGGGLLSASTLAALNSYLPDEASNYAASKPAAGGGLVGYGDSDEDDD